MCGPWGSLPPARPQYRRPGNRADRRSRCGSIAAWPLRARWDDLRPESSAIQTARPIPPMESTATPAGSRTSSGYDPLQIHPECVYRRRQRRSPRLPPTARGGNGASTGTPPSTRGQLTCTGNKVGVEVRFEGIRQSEAHPLGDLEITVHTPLRVDDGGYSGSRRTDQIGRIADLFMDERHDEQIGWLHEIRIAHDNRGSSPANGFLVKTADWASGHPRQLS